MRTASRLVRLGVAVLLTCGAARAQSPPTQELAGAARRGPLAPQAAAVDRSAAGDLSVPFRTGSAALTPTATRELDAFGHRAGASTLRVEGFADATEARDADRDLAQRRADAVARYLATLGVDRIEVAALCQAAPYSRRVKIRQESK